MYVKTMFHMDKSNIKVTDSSIVFMPTLTMNIGFFHEKFKAMNLDNLVILSIMFIEVDCATTSKEKYNTKNNIFGMNYMQIPRHKSNIKVGNDIIKLDILSLDVTS